MMSLFIIIATSISAFYLFSRRKNIIKKNKAVLFKKVDLKKLTKDNKVKDQFKTLGLIGTDCLFSFFYTATKIDLNVIESIQRVHGNSQNLDSIFDVIVYAKSNLLKKWSEQGARGQIIDKYKGYVGEEKHFDHLRNQGHEVIEPDSPNQEGYDAIVNGKKINVKVSNDESYIDHHLKENPDIPVHTGEELGHLDNAEGFSHLSADALEEVTESSMDAISDLGNVVPIFTLATSSIKNINKVRKGDKDVLTGMEHVTTDVTSAGAGFCIGGAIGSLIPVVGTLLGSIIGGYLGREAGDYFKKRHVREASEVMQNSCRTFITKFYMKSFYFIDQIKTQNTKYINSIKKEMDQNFLSAFFNPSLKTTFLKLAQDKHPQESNKLIECYTSLRTKHDDYMEKLKNIDHESKEAEEINNQFINFAYKVSQEKRLFYADKKLLSLSKKITKQIKNLSIEKKKVA